MLALMLNPRYKGLGLVINYNGKEWALRIVGKYDKEVLFLLLICAYNILNPSDTCERALGSSTSQNSQTISLYDCMDMDEDMALSIVKEQLTHFNVKKVIDDECKDPLAWWRAQEGHFSYVGFLVRQILGIVGSQIEVERVFSIASICTNLHHSRLGTESIEMLISIYKNIPKDVRVGGSLSMHKFMEMEEILMDENEEVIASLGLLEVEEGQNKV
jgi:hypothetical protein